ncbi:MAG: hypothetical protein IPM29_24430 [Planctomycetes bacterium]|nr:hypothetical protein [Planctomycetota bacterium]
MIVRLAMLSCAGLLLAPAPLSAQHDRLPPDAAERIRQFDEISWLMRADLYQDLARLAAAHRSLGDVRSATAIESAAAHLSPRPPDRALAAPQDLTEVPGEPGQSWLLAVTGSLDGVVRGTEVYTDDSALGAAAVHVGLLQAGQRGILRVTFVAGQASYAGTSCNGVETQDRSAWHRKFTLESVIATARSILQDLDRRWSDRVRSTLVPPAADHAVPDELPPAGRGVIEIDQRGRVRFDEHEVSDPTDDTELLHMLRRFRDRDNAMRWQAGIGGRTITLVDDPLLIRADRWTAWHHVARLMTLCSKPDAAIWKLKLGVQEARNGGRASPAWIPAYLPRDAARADAPVEPVEQLRIRIVCDELGAIEPRRMPGGEAGPAEAPAGFERVGHRVHWLLGPQRCASIEELRGSLAKLADDPSRRVPDARGGTRMMDLLIEPGPDVSYGDVVHLLDVVIAAGFESISVSAGR